LASAVILPFRTLEDSQILAQAIVNTIPEPFLVLDADLRVLAASRSFYDTFKVDPEHTDGCLLYALGDGQWDIPALRLLLETIIPNHVAMDDFEVDYDFPELGQRTMLLNARQVVYEHSPLVTILLAFRDVTTVRIIEREKADLLRSTEELLLQKQLLLEEMRHRVANSLQIIASIMMLKARAVSSEETRFHLQDAHARVMSVAAVQQHLHMADGIFQVDVANYLQRLCAGLAASMVSESRPVEIRVTSDPCIIDSSVAVSLGLIVTELVINALKYAFPKHPKGAVIDVTYEVAGSDWKLAIADNGVGKSPEAIASVSTGLGTTIVESLAKQLGASVALSSSSAGLVVAISHATFTSRSPVAA
jgi:chemotaxis protein methyltransferase CheR